MKTISFVCLGNICRSVMAEFIFKKLMKNESDIFITSASTSGFHDGEDMYYKTKEKLQEEGFLNLAFTSKKLSQELCDKSTFLIAMDNDNFKNILKYKNTQNKTLKMADFLDKSLNFKEIPDPYYTRDFNQCFDLIFKACLKLKIFLETNVR